MKLLAFVLCLFSLLLLPSPSLGQSYTGSSSSMAYGTFNGSDSLCIFAEWFYTNSGSGAYMWSGNAVRFAVTVSKYTSHTNLTNNNAVSTNTTTWNCSVGEWAVQQWNSTTARVSGTKYLTLEQGYISVVTISPTAHGSYRPNFYAAWAGFSWDGEQQTTTIDLLWPPDE